MFFFDRDIKAKVLDDKSSRKVLAHDKDLMACHLFFKKGGVGTVHSHAHTQIAYIIKGRFEFDMDGDKAILETGDSVYIPGDAPHGLLCLEEGELIDIFTPQREDFLG